MIQLGASQFGELVTCIRTKSPLRTNSSERTHSKHDHHTIRGYNAAGWMILTLHVYSDKEKDEKYDTSIDDLAQWEVERRTEIRYFFNKDNFRRVSTDQNHEGETRLIGEDPK